MKLIAILFLILSCSNQNWRTASRESAKLAPQLADKLDESIVQIYTARAFSWRGNFAVHPWVAWKKKNEEVYTVAQVIGWRLNSTGSAIAVEQDIPDRKWYGRVPNIIFEARAGKADKI